jgi:hypothetical protein
MSFFWRSLIKTRKTVAEEIKPDACCKQKGKSRRGAIAERRDRDIQRRDREETKGDSHSLSLGTPMILIRIRDQIVGVPIVESPLWTHFPLSC